MLLWMVAAGTLLLMAPVKGFAEDQPVPDIDSKIVHVWTGGYWTSENLSGRYRFVVMQHGFEHVSNSLYIQWISDDPNLNIKAETAVITLNANSVYAFGIPACDELTCRNMSLTVTNNYSNKTREMEIHIQDLGVITTNWR